MKVCQGTKASPYLFLGRKILSINYYFNSFSEGMLFKFPENGMRLWSNAPPSNSWSLVLGDERSHLKNAEPFILLCR